MSARRRVAPLLTAGALAALAAASCSKSSTTPGELMVSVQTDLRPGVDFDQLSVRVLAPSGAQLDTQFLTSTTPIPATLGIQVGADPSTPVTVQVKASLGGVEVVQREVVTTVPPDRIALLRVPLQWLCRGVHERAGDAGAGEGGCYANETCVEGQCLDPGVDVSLLPTYAPSLVFGGGSGPGDGSCFDTLKCFEAGQAVDVDVATCTFALPTSDASTLSIGLVVSSGGICSQGSDSTCIVPLDADVDWFVHDGRVQLPPAVCDANLRANKQMETPRSVVVTTACAAKDGTLPTCGPWSSVGATSGTFDAGPPAHADAGLTPGDGGTGGGDASDGGEDAGDPCADGKLDGAETDVDCGGGTCPACGPELKCQSASDCDSGVCDGASHTCACPADMVLASRSLNQHEPFCIDAHEVTDGQYAAWLAGSPDTASQDAWCSTNTSFVPAAGAPPMDDFPVTGVDWCDAHAYCVSRGRHLCGAVSSGGDVVPAADYSAAFNDAVESQWYDACSRGGARPFPYGASHVAGSCNDTGVATNVVTADTQCEGGIAGLFDMSGNVAEWEGSCDAYTGGPDSCRVRGGSFKSTSLNLACGAVRSLSRNATADDVGFRCCAY